MSPCRKLLPVLFPYDGIPGSPQPPFSISEYQKNSNTIIRKSYLQAIYMSESVVLSKYLALCLKLTFTAESEIEVNAVKPPLK